MPSDLAVNTMTPQSSTEQDYVTRLRAGLDELHKYQTRPSNQKSSSINRLKNLFESIPADLQRRVLDKATGNSIRRFRAAASLMAECRTSECVDAWISANLTHRESERRDCMIQIVGNQKLVRFAEEIVHAIQSDDQSRWWAVSAAGLLGVDECLDSLVALADSFGEKPIPMALIQSLAKYDSPTTAPHLQRVLDSHQDEQERVFAAWGLARQDHKQAIDYLVRKLDEDDGKHPSLESRRAAQALSDIFGWELEWSPEAPREAKERWAAQVKYGNGA